MTTYWLCARQDANYVEFALAEPSKTLIKQANKLSSLAYVKYPFIHRFQRPSKTTLIAKEWEVSNISILINMQKTSEASNQIQLIKAIKRLLNVQSSPLKVTVKKNEKCTLTQFKFKAFSVVSFFANNRTNPFHLSFCHVSRAHLKKAPISFQIVVTYIWACDSYIRRDHPFNVTDYHSTDDLNFYIYLFFWLFFHKWTHGKRRIKRIWSKKRIQQKLNELFRFSMSRLEKNFE